MLDGGVPVVTAQFFEHVVPVSIVVEHDVGGPARGLPSRMLAGELCSSPARFSLEEILVSVLAGRAILSAPAVPASTRISARLKSVQGHVSAVNA